MITLMKSWCEGIIVAVIISIIIETILPEGNNKKYVKVVIGIYIIFTILNPILGNLEFEIPNFDMNYSEESTLNTESIKNVYASSIENTMKSSIEENFDCKIKNLSIKYDDNYENIEEISIESYPQEAVDNLAIKSYISENYSVNSDRVYIK